MNRSGAGSRDTRRRAPAAKKKGLAPAGAPRRAAAPLTRAERVVRDVLEATLDELARAGYAALSIEEVATRAGVNKTTVYRRWPTKKDLVHAALLQLALEFPTPDTGSLRDDLLGLVEVSLDFLATTRGKALRRVMLAEAFSPGLLDVTRRLQVVQEDQYRTILDRARRRGELAEDADDDSIIAAIEGSFMYRTMVKEEVESRTAAARVIDLVLHGACARRAATSAKRR